MSQVRARPGALVLVLLAILPAVALGLPAAASAAQSPGVHGHVLWGQVDDAEMDRQLDAAKAGGVRVMRVDVGWSTLEEKGKGQYNSWYLSRIDRLVDAANQRGVKLLLSVMFTPCWASTAPADLKQDCSSGWWGRGVSSYAPSDPTDYADAMTYLVQRYRGRVGAWELWNEPNLDSFWISPNPAADYTRLVRETYPRVKQADPGATIVAGALSNSDHEFAQRLYQEGIGGHFDAFSFHPYSGDHSPMDPLSDPWASASFIRGVPAVREVMTAHGDNRPVWLTEFGYNTSAIRDDEPWLDGVDEATQARHLQDAFAQVQKWGYVDAAIWYNLKDRGTDPYEALDHFGLLRHDESRKPAFEAFKASAAAMSSGQPAPTGTSSKPGNRKGNRKSRRLVVRVVRRGGRYFLRGRATRGALVRLAGYRLDRRGRGLQRGPALRMRARARKSGHFSRRLPARRLRRAPRWRFAARTGRPAVRKTVRAAFR